MNRETVNEKAHRYLAEGRLTIELVLADEIRASCDGGERYDLGFEAGAWWCSCPARVRCAHLAALELVTDPEP